MLTVSNLQHIYPGNVEALRGVALDLREGELLCLAGANGCGKSTLLAVLAGILPVTEGAVSVKGREAGPEDLRGVCRLLMQDPDMQILGATVEEDLHLGRGDNDPEQARAVLDGLGFDAPHDRPVHALSWGMKRKLCLAGALLDDPGVLLFDEPFSGLDYPGIREMRRVLRHNREQKLTQVVAAHDLECVADIADRFALLAKGRIVAVGSADDVFDKLRENAVRPPCSWHLGRTVAPWDGSE
ncbi:energy-coupling factor ABC transporter ATP-binding protein [Salidesulfovibrio brasiliensis]|uniref:energy-coupling factor ABC transporter ATP-binding protein n=1 Tax=Salidesulfovibrio brasiliensis TaxID=221711 RepID=UPI0006D0C2BB|nr:ABC transporter ATP-binding protein [Salidesulfovibrio brasiliensis]